MEDSVNVLKFAECRAQEIMTLMEDVVSKEPKLTLQKLPYHMRRRAASHNPKRLPRSLRLKKGEETPAAKPKKKRKRHKSLLDEYNSRQSEDSWLPTHIWFAKRFHMKKMWGYQLPMQATGKRFRSSYRATVKKALLQDLSYLCCIELKGIEEKILSHLSCLTDDSSGMNFASESCIDGTIEGNCFLYHPDSYPYKAIGPISFLWNPSFNNMSEDKKQSNLGLNRQLWIWCHPTIHDELVQVLTNLFHLKESQNAEEQKKDYKFASNVNYMKTKLYFQKEPVFSGSGITMAILKNTLVRHRLVGPKTLPILTSVLNIEDCSSTACNEVDNDPNLLTDIEMKNNVVETNSGKPGDIADVLYDKIVLAKLKVWNFLSETKSSYSVPRKTVIGLTVDDPRLYITPRYSNYIKDDDLQACQTGDLPMLDEFSSQITSVSNLWNQEIRNESTALQVPEHVINSERAKFVIPRAFDLRKHTSKVPVIVIHQPSVNGYGCGWDIIAPQGWGMAFWIPFIYHGAQPAGFEDYCCLNLESGYPTFPCSFPDTKAGAAYDEDIRQTNLKKFYKYSRAKRPNFKLLGVVAPFFMPWDVLVSDWQKEFFSKFPRRLPESSNIGHLFSSSNLKCEKNGSFFTLRCKKQIMYIKHLCCLLEDSRKSPNSGAMLSLKSDFSILIQTLLRPQNINLKSIIPVRIKCLFRGIPSKFSGIYLPNECDIKNFKDNAHYFGPIETQHTENGDYLNMPAKKKRKLLKEEAKLESKKLDRAEVETIVSCCDRQLIGYISEGSYSRLNGQGCGVGHCTLTGFLSVLELCICYRMCITVLVREQHNFQYRLANMEIIGGPF